MTRQKTPPFDPGNVFAGMHHRVTGELLHLMDGLYSNIEDGLFEIAFRARHESQKRRCFDLMREMRFRRPRVVQTFAKRMQSSFDGWFIENVDQGLQANDIRAQHMADKCTAHFSGVLQNLAERAAYALGRDEPYIRLPIGPEQVALNFIHAMKALDFDDHAIEIVQDLFSRFVLERLGSVYGECNQRLEQAGFLTVRELSSLAEIRA